MDTTDIEIVRLLQKNGRMSHEQIAREVHLSRPAIHDRIRRLEENDVLQGYTAQVDWDAVGLPLTAFIWVRTSLSCLSAGRTILGFSSNTVLVEECHRVAGEWCLLVKTRSASSLALQELLDQISALPEVQNIMTTVALCAVRAVDGEAENCEIGSRSGRIGGGGLVERVGGKKS